ncbi:MAG: Beta-galactosidase BoGH2A [Luteibacter sp.]|uniref:beta-1,3-glucanase family protein n=1 Tax=Luteibacter sp. TaxID=1886636 RepID=UPI001385D16D|nr:beta-1,3-glucanase family protein [Luteibacter sp.]KAF1004663.1 MAG: Beta-galactosidase BoGH2A [Luteibacter sp.]
MKSHPASPPGSPGRRRLSAFIAMALLGATVTAQAVTLAPSDRQDINIGATPWKYTKQATVNPNDPTVYAPLPNGDDGAAVNLDDSKWLTVGLPHAANDFTTFINQESGGGQGSLDGSLSWYRKVLTDSASYRGKKVMLEFEGVHTGDRVYVNGTFVPGTGALNQPNQPNANATHVYGFIPHIVDLTPYLRYDGTDVIAVKVERDGGDIFEDPGFGGAFRFGQSEAGIFRPVKLHVTNLVHIPENVYEGQNTWGTYVGTQSLGQNNQSAVIDVQTNVVNDSDVPKTVTLTTQIVDENGKVVASDQQQELAPHQAPSDVTPVFDQHLTVSGGDLHLWWPNGSLHNVPRAGDTGRPRPYMYKVFHIVSIDGAIVDAKQSTLGIRTITWDKSYPYVNGERIRADGASGRYDYPALGSSVPEEQQWRDLQLFAAGGGNMWRPGHSSSSPEFVDAADALGVFIIQPSGDGEGGFDKECASKGDATAVSQCLYMRNVKREVHRDMVIRDRSHPSILAWETDNGSILNSFALELRALAAKWDDIAPRAASDRSGATDPVTGQPILNGDLFSCSKAGCETSMKAGAFKNLPVWGAEYWGIGSQRQAYDAQLAMALNYLVPYSQARSVGTFGMAQWYFADTPGETGNFDEGTEDPTHWVYQHINGDPNQPIATYPDGTKIKNFAHNVRSLGDSMVDQNRFPKMIYYIYDALWTPFQLQPVVKLANTWNRSGDIRVSGFTNCPAARLLVNDVQQGTDQQPNDWTSIDQASYNLVNGNAGDPNGPSETTGKMQNVAQAAATTKLPQQVHWDVTWQAGTAKLQCIGTDGNVVQDANGQPVEDVLTTAGKPDHILLTVVPDVALTKPDGSSFAVTANGSDAAFIEARVLDANNVLVPVDGDVNVTFAVTTGDSLVTYQGGTQQLVDWSAGSTTNSDGSQEPIHGYHAPGNPELKFEGGLQKIALRTKFTPGQVTVTATAAGMLPGSATFQISSVQQPSTPAGPPSLIATPQDDSVTVGSSGHFEAAVSGAQPMTFTWKKNGVVIDGATTSAYDTPPTQLGDDGSTYTVAAHNGLGDTPDSAPATLHVFPAQAVTITQPLQAVTVDAGQPVHFQVAAGGSPKLSYKWFRNGTQIVGADGPSYDISAAQASDAANFSVEVDNPVAPATSGPVALTVNAARPPVFTTSLGDVRANLGQSASFTASVTGSAPFHYQWKHGDLAVGTDSPTLTIPAVSQTDVGGYQVIVTNILGDASAATSNVAQLTLAPPGANLAREKVTYASGVQDANGTPSSFAVDGDGTTRWASEQDSDPAKSDAAWFEVDLGAVQTFDHVVIKWEAAYGADYKIQVSNDKDTGFTDVLENSTGVGGTDDLSFPQPVTGRYVRMQGVKRGTQYGYSMYEFEVYNTPSCCSTNDRFNVIDDNHVTDTLSGLTWERHERGFADQGAQYKRSNAIGDCGKVNARIPSAAEALAITGKNLSTNAFPEDWSTWTSDNDPGDADKALMVSRSGDVTPQLAENYPGNAICVSGSAAPLAAPVISTQPTAQTAGVGRSAHFAVAATGTGQMTYEWFKNGDSVSVTYDGTYATPALTSADNTAQYQVKVTNAQGIATLSTTVQLTVDNSNSGFDLPSWETPPQNTGGNQGNNGTGNSDNPGTPGDGQNGVNVALHAKATSLKNESDQYLGPANAVDGDFTTRWGSSFDPEAWIALDLGSPQTFDHVILRWENAYSTSHNIEVSNTGNDNDWQPVTAQPFAGQGGVERVDFPAQTARYVRMHSLAKNTAGYGVSLWEFEVYNPVTPQFVTQPSAQALTAGQTATFTVSVKASGQPAYQWRFNGVNIPGATQATYTKVVATTDAGNYDVVVTNGLGQSVTSNPAVLTVAAASQGTGDQGTGTQTGTGTSGGTGSGSNDPSQGFNYDVFPGFVGAQLRNLTNGVWSDDQIYVEVIAKDPNNNNAYSWLKPDGTIVAMSVNDNTGPGHLTKNGDTFPNYSFTLAQSKLLKIPMVFAGRIFVSLGKPLYMKNVMAADGTLGFAGPDLNNPTDPNTNIRFDWYEFTWGSNGMWFNTTQVDQFGIPLTEDLYGDNKTSHQSGGITESRAQILGEYNQEVPAEFRLADPNPLRIIAPGKGAFNAGQAQANYFDAYIQQVWTYYQTHNLHMVDGAMQFDGTVANGVLTLNHTNWADSAQPGEAQGTTFSIAMPNTQDVLEGKGALANGIDALTGKADPWGILTQLEAQLCGAFNRHVAEDVTAWNDPSQFYLQAPSNYYSRFWHNHNIGGKAYGFSYDDTENESSSLIDGQPEHLELGIGW